jgi:histidinol-phosphate aminotransferase
VSAQSPRFRPILDQFAPYKPGQMPSAPGGRVFKLSSNESPFGPLPSVLKVIAEAAGGVNRYPDNGAAGLTEAIAARFGVPASHVAVGCGSVGVAQQLLEAVGDPGAEVVYAWRSFEAYPYLSDLAGVTSVRVALRGEAHDLAAMADAITERTRLIFVCNGLDLYRDRPNLAVLRTFSKAYGLAGLRVGFLVGHEPVAAAVRKTMLTFTVNALAQAAAIASLDAEPELLERVEAVVHERDRVRGELLSQGWTVPPTQANFVWLRLGDDTQDFAAACDRQGVSVRPFGAEGARVSIGDQEANDAFLALARAYPRRH